MRILLWLAKESSLLLHTVVVEAYFEESSNLYSGAHLYSSRGEFSRFLAALASAIIL